MYDKQASSKTENALEIIEDLTICLKTHSNLTIVIVLFSNVLTEYNHSCFLKHFSRTLSKQWSKICILSFFCGSLCRLQRFKNKKRGANFHIYNVSIFHVSIISTDSTSKSFLFQNQPWSWMESKKFNNELVQCALCVVKNSGISGYIGI